ncbi:MAG: flagellar protein FlgN [Candidatus Hinthialibacter antarcticus]|nr:flagellar protein FlgN [Candidatus Hinthialibacter antarcticus]
MNLKPLIDALREEQKVHEKILLAKREERKWIAVGAAGQLLQTAEELQDLAEHAMTLDAERRQRSAEIARALGLEENATLKEILEAMPSANRPELETVGDDLRRFAHEVRSINTANRLMLNRAVKTLNCEISDLIRVKDDKTYNASGRKSKGGVPPRAGLNVRA